jgi:plastocyanin domain-containing protein
MKKDIFIPSIISIAIIGGTLYFVSDKAVYPPSETTQSQNIEIRDGIQYVTIVAKGGYAPRVTDIKGGVPTKLVVKTDGTYDCSASLIIRSVGFRKILQPSGEEIIDLGTPRSGDKVQGVCGMGMYSFQIKVS